MAEMDDWNKKVVDEFRANGGKVAGQFEGAPLLLLHTTGAKSGQARVNPVMYQDDGDNHVVFASKGGAPTNPDWYHNLVANPRGSIEVGDKTINVVAHVADDETRDRLWPAWKERFPGFAEYEAKTDRKIPLVVLQPEA
jgi:deazaflavin-dependent oxidoreductase (nitroreductase family)